jgi:multiple sugar transport system permease protein
MSRLSRRGDLVRAIVLIGAAMFVLFPIYWMAIMSIKPAEDFYSTPPVFFPAKPTTIAWAQVEGYRGWHGLVNSLIVASVTMVVAVVLGSLAGYSIARFRTGGNHLAFWFLSQRILVPVAVVLPIFLLYRNLKLVDTHAGLVILYTVFALPFTVWLTYTGFRQLPLEVEDAALVDGASRWQTFQRIALPLAAPGIVAAAVFAFVFAWTDFLFALFLTSKNAVTLPVIVSGFLGRQGQLFGELSALTLVSMVPALLLGLLVQRHLAQGLTMGAVNG